MKYAFLKQIALYNGFNGNDLRAILILCGHKMKAKELSEITGWDKGNASRVLKKLTESGVAKRLETDNGVFYMANTGWESPEVPGQLTMQL